MEEILVTPLAQRKGIQEVSVRGASNISHGSLYLPLACAFLIGGQHELFWFALATGTIGGLALSVLLALVVVPVSLMHKDL